MVLLLLNLSIPVPSVVPGQVVIAPAGSQTLSAPAGSQIMVTPGGSQTLKAM